MKIIYKIIVVLILNLYFSMVCFADSIVNSKHNLSASGAGTVKGTQEGEICIFCHAPHNISSAAPLWNRYESGQVYLPYTSTTLKAAVGQPTGASKLCLSCHDGTVALGMVRSRAVNIPFTQAITGEDLLGADLSDDHPVSFRYDSNLVFSNPRLKDPAGLTGAVRLDQYSELQCTSCHDPHSNQFNNFLRVDAVRGNLCLFCHNLDGWGESTHKNSTAFWNNVLPDPWPHTGWENVADNACENCHYSHSAPRKKRLLNFLAEENNCFTCHNGNVAQKNIFAEFNKQNKHPIYNYTGLHDPAENIILTSDRHVECADCHNPHAVAGSSFGNLPGGLRKISGVNSEGLTVNPINYEYELCFRCHADSNYASAVTNRQFSENNTRVEFNPLNQSYHPVENIGKNMDVPSLIVPLTTSSLIKCTDCHNNDTGPGGGGAGPKGPHGSTYKPILERRLSFADNQSESDSTYALCYKCHNRASILANTSFSQHSKHIVSEKSPCTACHDPHGVKNVPHLINFDRNIVSANSSGQVSFTDNGRYRGSCSLRCHNEEHNGKNY